MEYLPFCDSYINFSKRKSIEVHVGNIVIGGAGKVVIQSMATTSTMDSEGSASQAIKIAKAGGELVRFTAQGVSEAENLKNIKELLVNKGCNVPLVADIHFNPKAAFVAARHVEKVRINPGNFVDKRAKFDTIDYSDTQWSEELAKVKDKLYELLDICEERGVALRIGVNHGSLSDRMMSKYGDTADGMVASAMEFLLLCKERGFNNVVVSMKSSNTNVMVRAYRALAAQMRLFDMSYPLHLGVTEAGEGSDGRIRSAVGIGALMNDGIGDTIRVSLTEEPECEIPVAKELADHYIDYENHDKIAPFDLNQYNPYGYSKRKTLALGSIGGANMPIVVGSDTIENEFYEIFSTTLDRDILSTLEDKILLLDVKNRHILGEVRSVAMRLKEWKIELPLVVRKSYSHSSLTSFQIASSADFGALFIDGLCEGIWLDAPNIEQNEVIECSFAILQAARARFTRTEYISCPGCGRTLYDLQNVLREVKGATAQFSGVKIAVMGCIVNGPGEMADADYGYVGSGVGRITLYRGKEVIGSNIPQENAVKRLVELIKEDIEC